MNKNAGSKEKQENDQIILKVPYLGIRFLSLNKRIKNNDVNTILLEMTKTWDNANEETKEAVLKTLPYSGRLILKYPRAYEVIVCLFLLCLGAGGGALAMRFDWNVIAFVIAFIGGYACFLRTSGWEERSKLGISAHGTTYSYLLEYAVAQVTEQDSKRKEDDFRNSSLLSTERPPNEYHV